MRSPQSAVRDLNSSEAWDLGQRGEEHFPISLIVEDGFPAVAAVHDVVKRAGILKASFLRHACEAAEAGARLAKWDGPGCSPPGGRAAPLPWPWMGWKPSWSLLRLQALAAAHPSAAALAGG